jgi:hypothetical protein
MKDMRVYFHPSVGDYAKYDSFEIDHAALAGVPSGIAAGVAGWAFKRASWEALLASLGGGGLMAGAFGAFYPKRVLSWFNPPPFDAPIRYPRQVPKAVVPSFIGEAGQVLNLLCHHGSGDVVRDYSSYGNHGRIYGAQWIDGMYGWALYFNGTSAYVQVPDSPGLRLTGGGTIEVWVDLATLAQPYDYPGVLFKWDWVNGWKLTYSRPSNTFALERRNAGTAENINTAKNNYVAGQFYQIIFVDDPVANRLTSYINGVLDNQISRTMSIGSYTGSLYLSYGDYLNGLEALIRIYSRPFSAEEARYHFESTRSIFGA